MNERPFNLGAQDLTDTIPVPLHMLPAAYITLMDKDGNYQSLFLTFDRMPEDGNWLKVFDEQILPQCERDGMRVPTEEEMVVYFRMIAKRAMADIVHRMVQKAQDSDALGQIVEEPQAAEAIDLSKWAIDDKKAN